jgi:hypothetical protein
LLKAEAVEAEALRVEAEVEALKILPFPHHWFLGRFSDD